MLEGVAAALAVASLAAALRDRSAPLALLAPAALAVVAGVARRPAADASGRGRAGPARRRGRLPAMLSPARWPAGPARPGTVAVLTVAVALLAFSATAWDVAARARAQRADDALGAPTVYVVTAAHPQALVDAWPRPTRRTARWPWCASDELYANRRVELIGVQSDRLPPSRSGAATTGRAVRPRRPAARGRRPRAAIGGR